MRRFFSGADPARRRTCYRREPLEIQAGLRTVARYRRSACSIIEEIILPGNARVIITTPAALVALPPPIVYLATVISILCHKLMDGGT